MIRFTKINEELFDENYSENIPYFFKGIKSDYLNNDYAYIKKTDFIRPSKTVEKTYHFFDLSLNHCSSWKIYRKTLSLLLVLLHFKWQELLIFNTNRDVNCKIKND